MGVTDYGNVRMRIGMAKGNVQTRNGQRQEQAEGEKRTGQVECAGNELVEGMSREE